MAYIRVNWEDRPSTNTPINATNLNKMDKGIKDLEDSLATVATTGDYDDLTDTPNLSAVATSGDYDDLLNKPNDHLVNVSNEVDEDYRVNFLYSKNLFNENTYINGLAWNNGTGFPSRATAYLDTKPNTTYSILVQNISKLTGNPKIYLVGKTSIADGIGTGNNININDNGSYTFTANTNDRVLAIQLMMASGNINSTDYPNIMIVEGSTALPYEPYIVPSIVVDNEEIYSKWKYLGQTTGTTKLQLPNNWKELYIMAKEGSGATYETAIIMNIGLSAYTQYCIGGRFTSGTNGSGIMASIDADNKIGLNYVYVNSSDVVSNSSMLVYWK